MDDMSRRDLISQFAEMQQRTESPQMESYIKDVVLVEDRAKSEMYPLDKMSKHFRNLLDSMALEVIGASNSNKFLVLGPKSSGKSFFIEQLAFHKKHYADLADKGKMEFIRISDGDIVELGGIDRLIEFEQAIERQLGINRNEICFVTQKPQLALMIERLLPDVKIILEISSSLYAGIMQNNDVDVWEDWTILDVLGSRDTPKTIYDGLKDTLLEKLPAVSNHKISREDLFALMERVLITHPALHGSEDTWDRTMLDIPVVPPLGIWATCIKYLHYSMTFISDSEFFTAKGRPRMAKFIEFTASSCADLFTQFYDTDTYVGIETFGDEDIEPKYAAISGSPESANVQNTSKEVTNTDFGDMTTLAERLRSTLFGQDEAVDQISDALLIPAANLNEETKPIRSFLFLGPTGVGKTQMALNMAKDLYKEEVPVVRLDMGEYQNWHEVAKLFGAPPGYKGFDETDGALTGPVAKNPRCIVLLDEVEKAHPRIWDAFLQILDAGRMTSGRNELVDFTKTIIIMTSNLGAESASKDNLGFSGRTGTGKNDDERTSIVKKAMEQNFRPEFINRIDDIVIFKELSIDIVNRITAQEIDKISKRLSTRQVVVSYNDAVVEKIMDMANFRKYGARDIQRVVQKNVSTLVARYVLSHPDDKEIHLSVDNGKIKISNS